MCVGRHINVGDNRVSEERLQDVGDALQLLMGTRGPAVCMCVGV
jgi:hypothetical protein